MIIIIILD